MEHFTFSAILLLTILLFCGNNIEKISLYYGKLKIIFSLKNKIKITFNLFLALTLFLISIFLCSCTLKGTYTDEKGRTLDIEISGNSSQDEGTK